MASSRQRLRTVLVAMVATALPLAATTMRGEERSADPVERLTAESDLIVPEACRAIREASDEMPNSLVVNGGFEQRSAGQPPNYIESFGPGATDLAGWEVSAGNVDWIGPTRWRAAAGRCCLDLDAPGAIRQIVATMPGKLYVLAFDLAGNVETEPAMKKLAVELGGKEHTFCFDATRRTRDDLGWVTKCIVFRAESETTMLTFVNASGEPTASGVALDNVSVQAAESPVAVQQSAGRYSLAAAGDRMVLLDSATGRTWILVEGDAGPVWKPIERVEQEAERGTAASGAQRANLPATPSEARGSVAAAETAPPEVRILAAERTTLADIPFVSFSCQATNPNKAPVTFAGYRPDSFGPPLQGGQIAPIYVVQLQRDGEWKEHPIGWCGTGMDAIELSGGGSGTFGFAVPAELQWEAARVGIRWSPPLTVPFEEVPLAEEEPFITTWSEPFGLEEIDEAPRPAAP